MDEHLASERYQIATAAEEYYAGRNTTISLFQRFLRSVEGKIYPDVYSSNYKTKSGFFRKMVMQQVQYILGNGMTFERDEDKQKLGDDIDVKAATAAKIAMIDGVSFLFFNLDHIEVFGLVDTPTRPGFLPLFDEFSGELMAGIRYWYSYNSANVKRLNAVVYTEEGYTAYKEVGGGMEADESGLQPYITTTTRTAAHGVETMSGYGYGTLPIVPMYANDTQQSELVFVREAIDCYDFEKNGLANDIDDNSGVFWLLKNSGGMDDLDIAQFLDRLRTVHAAAADAEEMQPVSVNVPVEARRTILEILEADFYRDAMLFNTKDLSAGNKTATEINAAYQAQDDKCADFENFISTAISTIFAKIFGGYVIPKFKWQKIANQTEYTQMVMSAYPVLGIRLTLEKLPFLTPEEVQQRLDEAADEDLERLTGYSSAGVFEASA